MIFDWEKIDIAKVSIGEVCAFLGENTKDPAWELEMIIKQARADDVISKAEAKVVREYKESRQVIAILGHESKTQAELKRELGVSSSTIVNMAERSFDVLAGYLWQYAPKSEVEGLNIKYLPWAKHDVSARGRRASHRLIDEISRKRSPQEGLLKEHPVYVRDVMQYFSELERAAQPIQIVQYGQKSLEVTLAVFKEIGIDLPTLRAE